jgi:hypothetical protein
MSQPTQSTQQATQSTQQATQATQATQNKSSKKMATTTTTTAGTTQVQQPVKAKKKLTILNPQYKRNFKNDDDDDHDDDDDEERTKSGSTSETSDNENEKVDEGVEASSLSNKKYKKSSTTSANDVEYAKLLAELFPSSYSKQKATTLAKKSEKEKGQKKYDSNGSIKNANNVRLKKTINSESTMTASSKGGRDSKSAKDAKDAKDAAETSEAPAKSSSTASNSNVVGNYNIVINIKEPFEDLLEDEEYTSDMDDSVYDDDSASSNESSDNSDETYHDDDSEDDDDSEVSESEEDDEDDEESETDEENTKDVKKDGFEKCKLTIKGSGVGTKGYKKDSLKLGKEEGNDNDETDDDSAAVDSGWNTEDETTIQAIKSHMEGILALDKNNKIAKTTLAQMIDKEKKIKDARKERTRKIMRKNVRKFGRLLHKKNSANDLKYFKKHLSNEQQAGVLSELEELNKMMLVEKPYRLTLLESKIPKQYKAIALKRIQNLRYMDPGAGEYYKVKNWVDTFMTIPFGVNRTLPITMDVGVERCHDFMESAKDLLDSAVYGLNDAKMQIMQMVGQWISNPSAMGSAIAIKGPPGTGKTTLVKEGISKILGRDFAFIALGGATDSSFLEGHSYTYEGSTWGKIVDILIRCKSMNPVIFFDELDKLSDTPKGEEIAGILTHLTDTSQNSQFHDKYFSEIHFDLSKCLFIFSYNDETRVNPILLDRMYRIHTNGYTKKDKTQIAQKYLIPKIQTEVAFKPDQIIIPDETIEYIVEHHTNKEDGVRNLKRCLEIVYTKLNLYRLMKPGTKLFDKDATSIEVSFPFTVTNRVVDIMIKKSETNYPTFMYT